ncbi:DUF4436 family protein [Streptomyces sp. NPDC058294]|uniref:DUF4436 family protein n=1 Tax=Streptomyces sp. NPDC058294 TaxID=3346430 RepID=UPI0036ECC497
MAESPKPWRLYAGTALVIALLVALLAEAGTFLYAINTSSEPTLVDSGDVHRGTSMWLDLDVRVKKVDPGPGQVVLSVWPVGHGSLERRTATGYILTEDVRLISPYLASGDLLLAKNSAPHRQQLSIVLYGGPTDYPWDSYSTYIQWKATSSDGTHIPVTMRVWNEDPFFTMHSVQAYAPDPGSAGLELNISRSGGTFILAWILIASMWTLAFAVLAGARVLVRQRQGLIWPSLGWMAATFFALVGLRNAAPGTPPIGSLFDYIAFFWAEGIIAVSLASAVLVGYWDEHSRLSRPRPSPAAPEVQRRLSARRRLSAHTARASIRRP